MITGRITKFSVWESSDAALIGIALRFGGGKSQQSTSQVSVPPEVLAQYQNVNSIANQVAQTPFEQYSTNPSAFVAPLTPTQQAGILGASEYSGPATQSGIQYYENPNESAVIQPTVNQMENQFNQAQSSQLGNAIQQGAFGGDRTGVAAANLQNQQALALGQTVGGLENQNYSQALGAAQQAQQQGLAGAQAQLTAGQAQQQTEQAGLTALYNQFLQQQSYPFQTTQFQSNIAEGTGALSGSTTSSNQPAPYFSDERLKDDIEPIGKTFDGLNIIKFKYKGDKQPHIGLSAQDVEKKHPEAIGLAGGYKTVDYDAATRYSADKGRVRQGGLVTTAHEGHVDNGRRHFDVGGSAGLAPNSAYAAGFTLDPSYLQAQEAAYANAPWGNAGPVSGSAPYGGKSHVPPSTGSPHAALAVAHAPQQSPSGLQQLSSGISQLEGLGKTGKALYNDAKGAMPGLGGNPPPVAAPPPVQMPPDKAAPPAGTGLAAPVPDPSAGRANAQQLAEIDPTNFGLDPNSVTTPDTEGLGDLGSLFSKNGGRIQRDAGGATYQDAASDDASAGGDVPYDSGTGEGGLDIPDDKPHNSLATSQPPSSTNSGGGLGDILGDVGKIASFAIPFLNRGGRVGLAGGGDPGDLPPLDDMDTVTQQSNAQGLDVPAVQSALRAKAQPQTEIIPTPTIKPKPRAGLNPDAPSPDAQPVQMQQQQIQDMGSGQHITQPGEVLSQDGLGGIGDTLNRNQGLIVPLLHGLGTMASSNSRYLGSAILQGLGGAADSYENTQNEMQGRAGNQPIIQQRQNDALNSDLNLWQSYIGQHPGASGLSFPQFEQLKASGKLQTYQGSPQPAPQAGRPQYNYSVQEKNTGIGPDGIPLSQNQAYLSDWAAHHAGNQGPFMEGQVHQSNLQAGQINNQGFTNTVQGVRVPVPGYASTVLAQSEPDVQAKAGADFRTAKTDFLNAYQPTQSLLNEMKNIYQTGLRAGPSAELRASISNWANDFDPQGKIPLLHSLSENSSGEDYQTAMKDIAQITAQRLSGMSQNAPKSETELLSQFAANPDRAPGTVRDVLIRGQALLNQQHDYYKGYDPFRSNQAVPDYTDSFYENNPFEKYRMQLEKTTPAFKGEQANARNQPGATQAPSAPITLDSANPDAHYQSLPSGSRFVGPDGKVRVKP